MSRVGFLLNHDAAHQVMHSAPTAFELARRYPDTTVVIISTTDAETEAVKDIAAGYPDAKCELVQATVPTYASVFDRLTGHAFLAKRFGVLWSHREMFRSFDVLIVPDKTTLVLKRWLGKDAPIMVHTFHGAGDRSGGYRGVAGFDYYLLPGKKYQDRMLSEGMVSEERCKIAGYVKFDLFRHGPRKKFFNNDNPTILYTPHFDPRYSSWYEWGEEVLRYFMAHKEYNLIFAPHVLMYRRRWHISTEGGRPRITPKVPDFIKGADNIIVDTGSLASIDMTYIRSADLYLGDVSSQVYEFMIEPRPVMYLNSGDASWQNDPNFLCWHCGDVVDAIEDFPAALEKAMAEPQRYRRQQEDAAMDAFDLSDTPAAIRAADAIRGFMVRESLVSETAPVESGS